MMIIEMAMFTSWRISSYTQDALTYGTHLFLAILLLVSLAIHKFHARQLSQTAPVEAHKVTTSVSVLFSIISILCCLIGLANLGLGVWLLMASELPVPYYSWVSLVLQGLVWLLLGITFKLELESFVAIIACAWWIFTFLLMTFYAYSSGMQLIKGKVLTSGIILVFISWPISWIFIPCAIINLRKNHSLRSSMTEPLLSDSPAGETRDTVNPLERAGIFSKLCFTWLSPLLALGNQRPLQRKDIPDLGEEDQCETAYQAFLEAWEMQKKNDPLEPQSVLKALIKCHWRDVTKTGFYALLKCITLSSGPLVLFAFIGFSTGQEVIEYQGFILVGGLLFLKLLESVSQRHWYFGMRRVGLRIRAGLLAAIYQKELRLSNLGRQRHGSGEIVSYVSVDAYRLGEFTWWLHQIWLAPLQVIIALAILYAIVGWAFLPGLFVILITVAINGPFATHMQKCQSQLMQAQDERLKMMTVIISSMKIVKLQAWEDHFKSIIEALRQSEFKWLSSLLSNRSYGSILYWMSPIVTASIVLGTAVFLEYSLTSTVVFTVLATFRIIQEPVRYVPDVIANTMQAKVSISRLNNFLLEDELQPDAVVRNTSKTSDYSVSITNGKLSWDPVAPIATLSNINMLVKHGELVAICGMVGSGKSTLLCAILGEISKLEGTVQVNGRIAYVAQTAWIQSGTVRDNILFGQPMNMSRYKQALSASALDQDIEQFLHGDLTEIGERGLNMSGGQKQRIQLARAVYSDADIFLLDDPFSAVDAHTAAILFKECILGALSKKTVILVTHQVEFLPSVDTIVVMHSGTIKQMGGYEELLMAGNVFEQLVSAHQEAMVADNENDIQPISVPNNASTEVQRQLSITKSPSRKSAGFSVSQALQLVQEEEREKGDLGLKPYLQYIRKDRGTIIFTVLVLAQLAFVTVQFLSNYWLATQLSMKKTSAALLIGMYAALAFGSIAFLHVRSRASLYLGLGASRAFFSGFLDSLFRAPMAVFDSTPIGRILSRASTDLSILDIDIPFALGFVAAGSTELLIYVIAIALVTWQVLFIAIPTLAITWRLQSYYLQPTRELMRINGTSKAPIVNNSAETISGAVTIRAFQKQKLLEDKNQKLIDNDSGVSFYIFTAYEWVALRLETLGTIVLCSAALIMVLLPKNHVKPGFAGLSLSYGLGLNPLQLFLIQWSCNLANYIISVERIEQYMKLPCEAPAVVESNRPAAEWPSKGKIEFQNLHVRYRKGAPLVLRGITCIIEGGQRVGVVGRTGSGKTTLISSLFRLVEPADGRIIIDSIDIAKIGIRDLRSKLGIIPQEPFLFRGTVRSNLDPLQQHTDDEIWEILAKCQLKKTVEDYQHQLDAPVSDDGENWSAGQRQLFCLGRVLLKRSRILVLDEATASIDATTDSLLQKVIREEFDSCTVITVAHRISTVIDSDMIMALRDGKLMEFDNPLKLMEEKTSLFARLVTEYWSNSNRPPASSF